MTGTTQADDKEDDSNKTKEITVDIDKCIIQSSQHLFFFFFFFGVQMEHHTL